MEGKAAVLGEADFVMPYSSLGLDTYAVEFDADSIVQTASEILKKRYALIVVAENVAMMANDVLAATQRQALPSVVVVPFTSGSEGFATQALGKLLKMATGINILAD